MEARINKPLAIFSATCLHTPMPEYYLKPDAASEAKGPFTQDDLLQMAKDGRISPATMHFYDDLIGWQPISANATLQQALFIDARPKLSLKKVEPLQPARTAAGEGLTVQDMLQSAQGNVSATKGQTVEKRWADRVGALSLPLLAIFNLAMGGLLAYAHREALSLVMAGNTQALVFAPGLILGLGILLVGALLMLSLVAAYPAVRYLGLIAIGYLGLQSWSYLYEGLPQGWLLLGAGLGYGLGVYAASLTLNFSVFMLSVLLALGGIASYGYFLFFLPG